MKTEDLSILGEADLDPELVSLRHREAMFEASEQIALIGHYEWDNNKDCLLSCSRGYANIFNLTPSQALQNQSSWKDTLNHVHPEDRAEYTRFFENGPLSGAFEFDYRLLLVNGEIKHIRETGTVIDSEDKSENTTFGIVQDITYRVKYERDLENRDELARQVESITDIGHFIYDEAEEKYLYLSDGLARIYGTNVADYMAKVQSVEDDLADIHVEDRERVAEEYKHYITSGEEYAIEYRFMRSDGAVRWLRELSKGHVFENNRARQTLGVVQDVTDRVLHEQELMFKDALANQAEAITDIGHYVYDDIKEKYLFVSEGMANIFGLNAEVFKSRISRKVIDFETIHEEDRGRVLRLYEEFLAGKDSWQADYRMLRADGEIRWVREMGKVHLRSHGIPEQTIGVVQDITDQKKAQQEIIDARDNFEQQIVERTRELASTIKQLREQIEEREKIAAELDFMANHDALTGLPSLRLCKDRLEHSLAEARRRHQVSAVMFLDLDGFKAVNDSHGHEFGDLVLKVTADRIKQEIRETDTVARIGGDEFIIILSSLPELTIVERIASNIITEISQLIRIENIEVEISVSIGIALYPEHGETSQELMRSADGAMYQVKHAGKNSFAFA